MSEKYIISGKGFLSYANLESLCKHGKKDELVQAEKTVSYLIERSQEDLEKLELGAELLGIDFVDLEKKLVALKEIGATKKQIKKVIGTDLEKIEKIASKRSELSYRTNMREKIKDAQG